jgi:hypothetical protein
MLLKFCWCGGSTTICGAWDDAYPCSSCNIQNNGIKAIHFYIDRDKLLINKFVWGGHWCTLKGKGTQVCNLYGDHFVTFIIMLQFVFCGFSFHLSVSFLFVVAVFFIFLLLL